MNEFDVEEPRLFVVTVEAAVVTVVTGDVTVAVDDVTVLVVTFTIGPYVRMFREFTGNANTLLTDSKYLCAAVAAVQTETAQQPAFGSKLAPL